MINVSDAFETKIENGFPVVEEVQITFADGKVKTVKEEILNSSNELTDGVEGNSFPIGNTVCKTCTLALDNSSDQWKDYNFYGAKLKVKLKMSLDDGATETINKGTYTVTVPEEYGEDVELTALDDMYKANKAYTTNLQFPQTAFSLLRDACRTCGISLGVTSMKHGDIQVSEVPEDLTFRVLIGYIAMLDSANARIDTNGYLQFIKWDFSDTDDTDNTAVVNSDGYVAFDGGSSSDSDNYVLPAGTWVIDAEGYLHLQGKKTESIDAELREYISSPTLSTDDIVVTGIKVKNGDASYLYGKEGYVLELENTLLQSDQLQTAAGWIGDELIGIKFRSMEGDLLYNPLIEFGDMARTYDRKGNAHITPITYAASPLNGKTTLKTQAESPIRGTSQYYSANTKTVVEARKIVQQEKSERDEAIKKLKDGLSDGSGMYETSVKQEDGSTISYIHDKETIEKSKIVIKLTSNAIGVSNDGGKTYPCGFTFSGILITRLLYAEGINADYIDTGALSVRDEDGNVIFQADIDNKTVRISGDCVMIGDRTISKAITDTENAIAEVKNMSVQLSNEYQGIPVDAEGNVTGTFPEVKTVVSAFYGAKDISNDCSYIVQKSDTITGYWGTKDHTYTVTNLTGETGWVDIRATYLQTMSITKRFTVIKQRGGNPGRVYILEPSCNIVKRGANKTLTPNFLEFKAYYMDGDSTQRNAYKGRMIIEKTTDGETWSTLYTSSVNESTKKYSISNIALDVTNIRCKLYAAGGTVNMLDMQSVPIMVDVAALTAEEIVNILSNDGEWKGLYYLNGHLYISFDAAKGGTIALGGPNNGNGQLKIYGEDGTEVLRLDNGGLALNNADEITILRLLKNGVYFYDSTGEKRKVVLGPSGLILYTDYTDSGTYKALRLGKYGLYAVSKDASVEELWMEGTNHKWDGYVIRYLNNAVRVCANAVYTEGCSMGENLTTSGTFYFYDWEQQSLSDNKKVGKRQPVTSITGDGSRVAYLGTGRGTPVGDTRTLLRLAIRGQWGSTEGGYTTDYLYVDSQVSDIRLKDNVKNSKVNALETVNKMQVRQFDWIKGGHQDIGFVADELEEIDPNLAMGGGYDENGEMDIKQINISYMMNYAIKAIQELSDIVKKQDDKIKKLEEKLNGN